MTFAKKGFILLMLMSVLFVGVLGVSSSAVNISLQKKELNYFLGIENKSYNSYPKVAVKLGDTYISDTSYLINDTTYIPFRAAATLAGAAVSFDADTRTAKATMKGLELIAQDGSYIAYANERTLLARTPAVILSDGKMYIPIRTLAAALSLSVKWLPERIVQLTGTPTPIIHGDKFYSSDDLYWLSRIISAESRGEPLLGQIAVGNVVLNRKAHPDYPNTVWGVIFDKKYGVQFSPVKDGSIYKTPSYLSVQAAKICLEGVSVSDEILFFLEPTKASSAWIVLNRKYAYTIGNHYFFI